MIRLSTGLRSALIWDAGIRSLMWAGTIELYTGPQPTSADVAPTGDLIARITEDGDTFTPGVLAGGLRTAELSLTALKHEGTWVLNGLGTGVPGWWRWKWNGGDNDALSFFYPRVDGDVAESLFNLPAEIEPSTQITGIEFNFAFLTN